MKFISGNEQETAAFAKRVARRLKGGEVLLLQGDLGAGKTTFVRGLARVLGVRGRIKSPTFTLMHVHKIVHSRQFTVHSTLKHFVHCDAYRIKDARALLDIGLMDFVGRPDTVVVIEWGEKVKPLFKRGAYSMIKFEHGEKESERTISVSTQQLQRPPQPS